MKVVEGGKLFQCLFLSDTLVYSSAQCGFLSPWSLFHHLCHSSIWIASILPRRAEKGDICVFLDLCVCSLSLYRRIRSLTFLVFSTSRSKEEVEISPSEVEDIASSIFSTKMSCKVMYVHLQLPFQPYSRMFLGSICMLCSGLSS